MNDVLVTLLGQGGGRTNYARCTWQPSKELASTPSWKMWNSNARRCRCVEARSSAARSRNSTWPVGHQARYGANAGALRIPELRISLRQFNNQLCILLGIPPEELRARLGPKPIPTAPVEAAIGIPADLLRRRPGRQGRASGRQPRSRPRSRRGRVEFYPHIAINGTWEYSACRSSSKDLWSSKALAGNVGPTFTWNILNYGRILNGVRLQDARFQELVATYQNTVLSAGQDVENGLVTFLEGQQRTKFQAASVKAAEEAVQIAVAQYKAGTVDFTRVTQLEQNLVTQQDTLAQAQGEIVTGLVQVYKALGGGWQIREQGCTPTALPGDQTSKGATEPTLAPRPLPMAEPRSEKPASSSNEQTPAVPPK